MKKILTIIPCVLSLFCMSQNISFDLSKKANFTQTINPQKITSITLVNALAKTGTVYNISIIVKHIPSPFLSIPSGVSGAGAAGGAGGPCKPLDDATDTLLKESDESQIPDEITNLQKEMKNALSACSTDIPSAQAAIDATTKTFTLPNPIIVGRGDELSITISREKNTWSYTLRNEQPNHWTTYYGFTYIPDVFTKFANYYANQQTGGTYIISKMNGTNKNVLQNVSPTAMFTYRFFDKNPDAIIKFGLTGGIFYNTEILGAMLGPSLVIADNVTLNTGISFAQKYKLKGQYKDGQTIQNTLDFSQLHDKIWSYDMFISIGFNLPELFTKKSTTSSTPAK